ncbi:hypothetical protein SRB17_26370 [Streptomyces sp. RB17]|nr:hypothetical protein [Streptomyces sp. RB17]
MARPVPRPSPSAMTVVRPTALFAPDASHAVRSWRLPGTGRPRSTMSLLSASMTTSGLVEYRWFFGCSATV